MASLMRVLHIIPSGEYKNCIIIFISMLIGAAFEAVGIGMILPLLSAMGNTDFLHQHEDLLMIMEWIGINEHKAFIIFSAVALMVFYITKNVFLAFLARIQIKFVIRNQIYYSGHLLAEYLSKPYLFHVNNNTATLLRNVNDGALIVFSSIVLLALNLISECVTSFTIGIMLMVIDPFTACCVGVILGGLVFGIIKIFRKRIARQGKILNARQAEYLTWVNQSLGAIKETKIMHTENFFKGKFDIAYRAYGKARGDFDFLNQVPRLLIEAVVVSGLLILIALQILVGKRPEEIVPLLGLLSLAAFRLMPSANRIVAYYNAIKFRMPFFYEIYPEFMNIKNKCDNSIAEVEMTQMAFNSDIEVRDLAFAYDGKNEIFKGINFTIHRGDFVGIIGSSGAGKTTFVDVFLGLLSPSRGNILVDGVSVNSNIRGWQENVAYVPQNIYLIDATIKENIALGIDEEKIDMKWLNQVIHMAEMNDYVEGLPKGVDTVVGERGVRLSGGQRQRIGIARALYRHPKVLVLDEATSALDNLTEKRIMETVLQLKGQITIIAIAHRLSTLNGCDYKIKFHDRICEVV